jgi:putative membrane protein|tara:strand:- start:489 stop:1367 length:879 start_codon:yes stop_codon:yes gene_type:complete
MAVGLANIIPGVSGGTIALITGIFERLINAIKSFGITTLTLLIKGKFKAFAEKTDLYFLISLFVGVIISLVAIAHIFGLLFEKYPVFIWSFFFGLILASVYFVGKTITNWKISVVISFIVGTIIAILFAFFSPASQDDNFFYLILCGVVAVCSMILPGLSGSFVLILMGNYQLVAIDAINNRDINILLPVLIGAIIGLVTFSHIIAWVFKKYKDQTIGVLTGFILGSLVIIWPWKIPIEKMFGDKLKPIGYDYFLPELNSEFSIAILIMTFGVLSIWIMERSAANVETKEIN